MAWQGQQDISNRMLDAIAASPKVIEFADKIKECEQSKKAEKHEDHTKADLACQIAADQCHGADPSAGPDGPPDDARADRNEDRLGSQAGHKRTSEVRRQKRNPAMARTTA